MATVIKKVDLPGGETSRQFEGYLHGDANISFFINDTPPGKGPSLHQHPYEEVFIVQDGCLTFTVGHTTFDAVAGQIVVVPPETPHKFINAGPEPARHVDVHVSPRMITTWLEG
ncbi:cupin domain-containing protein [Phototrophicus methaneseepsis]|uniref:cupin domain-containing protein n=1 Tax=Phototrophicus methaneseepsis TaxID=2710758 RepID=UPI001E470FF0|nr:cupin domain-containing protein [Phototrophicus methaneseepsis]